MFSPGHIKYIMTLYSYIYIYIHGNHLKLILDAYKVGPQPLSFFILTFLINNKYNFPYVFISLHLLDKFNVDMSLPNCISVYTSGIVFSF